MVRFAMGLNGTFWPGRLSHAGCDNLFAAAAAAAAAAVERSRIDIPAGCRGVLGATPGRGVTSQTRGGEGVVYTRAIFSPWLWRVSVYARIRCASCTGWRRFATGRWGARSHQPRHVREGKNSDRMLRKMLTAETVVFGRQNQDGRLG